MRKPTMALALALVAATGVSAQNLQFHYDLGSALYRSDSKNLETRPTMTTTLEMFRPDDWGSTFFFVDMNYGENKVMPASDGGVLGAYWEIAREFKFWEGPVSAHVEYNGGMDRWAGAYNDAWLAGPTYSYASKDFSKTFSLSLLYKAIPRNDKSVHNFQVTGVWNVWFWKNRFLFCGFLDFWKENRPWQHKPGTIDPNDDGTDFILLSEPQIWYNLNTVKGLEKVNLSVGGEVEISNNFVGYGFYAIPTLAVKWTF